MKKAIVTMVMAFSASQMAQAADTYCVVNVENKPESQVYDKALYSEKVDTAQSFLAYLTADGRVVEISASQEENISALQNGTVVLTANFNQGLPSLVMGTVKKSAQGTALENISSASSLDGKKLILIAHKASFGCFSM